MKKFIFLLAFLFASFSFLSAQNAMPQSQEPTCLKPGKCEPREETRADYTLKYITGDPATAYGNASVSGTRYYSGCIYFSQAQMFNYVGATLHQINTGFGTAANNGAMTAYKIWIKTSLDGPIVYEQTVTPPTFTTSYQWKQFPLTTPYTITNSALVIGWTATFVSATAVNMYPMACSTNPPDSYKPGGFNYIIATTPNAHGAGAVWSSITAAGNLAIEGLLTNAPTLPTNDLAAAAVKSYPLKWVGNQATYAVTVFNAGSASQSNYTVQVVDAANTNTVLGTTTVTTALAPGALVDVNVTYSPTTAGNLSVRGKVVLTGDAVAANNISDPLTQKVYAFQPLAYCDNSDIGGFGNATIVYTFWRSAIEYSATNIVPFLGKRIASIEIGLSDVSILQTTATVWIRSSLTGANLYEQNFTPVSGWNNIVLTTPYLLQNQATYIGYTLTPTAAGYAAGFTGNTPNVAAGRNYETSSSGGWTTIATATNGHFAIIGVLEPVPNMVTVTTAVNPANSGTVTGAGGYTIGAPVTLTATPKMGYTFTNWTNGTTVLSTANPYTFNASANATITANFQATGGVICDDNVIVGTGTATFNYMPISTWEYS